MSQKSYNDTPTLYLIPTPIGNLEDITLRSIKILSEVDVILSEDTRVTAELLNHLKIKKKLIASHRHNEKKNQETVLNYLKNGQNVGLVSDRGTPIISDPGYEITKYIISQNYNVVALPGATALIPALITSGLTPQPFTFFGFLDSKESKRKEQLDTLKNVKSTLIFYEAPHRLLATLENIKNVLGDRNISISREITKKFEEIFRGSIAEIIPLVKNIKGEIVIVVDGDKSAINYTEISVEEHINFYLNQGKELKEAMKLVAKMRKTTKSEIYKEHIKRW